MKEQEFDLQLIPKDAPEAAMGVFLREEGDGLLAIFGDGKAFHVSLNDYLEESSLEATNDFDLGFLNSQRIYFGSRSGAVAHLLRTALPRAVATVAKGTIGLRTASPLNGSDELLAPQEFIRFTAGAQTSA